MEKNTEIKLERKLNPLNVWSLALGSIIGWGAFVMPGTTFLPKAGTLGTAIGLSIGALIMITIALNYGYMIQKYPVAGGEYTFTQNTFGRRHAYICGWFLGLSYLSIVPLNATALGLVSRKLLGGLLEVGYLYSVAGWDIYAGEIALASFALILFALLSIKGISVAGWLQTVMALSLVASVFILFIGAFLSPQVEISNLQPLFPEGKSSWSAVIAVVAIAPWAFVGFDSIPQAAEEFNFSPKKANGIMIIAIVFGAFVYIAVNTVTAAVEPWQEFLARVGVQLRRAGGSESRPKALRHHDLVLNESTYTAAVSGTELPLTRQEFKILELLLSHPDQVFSKQDIYDYAWDDMYIGEDKTINVHISNIRKKLKAVSDREYIETVWGIGFKLAK